MRKLVSVLTIATLVVGATGVAQATISKLVVEKCSSVKLASQQVSCAKKNIHHGRTTLKFLRRHHKVGTMKSRKSVRRSAKWLIRYGHKQLKIANARLLPPHNEGWECIHRQEAAWNDANAPYYGGLQMSWNWMKSVPGGDAGKLPAIQQKWIAERVSARQGFTSTWLHSQWPNTFPSCAIYF